MAFRIDTWRVSNGAKLISKRREYKISLMDDATLQCSCPAWTRTSPRKNCKHINKCLGDTNFVESFEQRYRIARSREFLEDCNDETFATIGEGTYAGGVMRDRYQNFVRQRRTKPQSSEVMDKLKAPASKAKTGPNLLKLIESNAPWRLA